MAIIVLQEMDKQMPPDFGPGAAASFIAAVHAAPADPDVPGDPDDRTFCGRPTLGMEPVPYRARALPGCRPSCAGGSVPTARPRSGHSGGPAAEAAGPRRPGGAPYAAGGAGWTSSHSRGLNGLTSPS